MNESAAAIKHRKPVKVGKLIVTLLTLFSLVGIASTPASASFNGTDPLGPAWTFTVTVSGEEPEEPGECVHDYGPATWEPNPTLSGAGFSASYDATAPSNITFSAELNFIKGTDAEACPEPDQWQGNPTGTVLSSVLNLDDELALVSLSCPAEKNPACSAEERFMNNTDVIDAVISVADGTPNDVYEGTLYVEWNPEG
jgi:hypothetical protein